MINVMAWLVVGGVIGWLAIQVMELDQQEVILLNVLIGVAGAGLAGWVISPLAGVGTIHQNHFNAGSLLVAIAGAVMVLAMLAPLLSSDLP